MNKRLSYLLRLAGFAFACVMVILAIAYAYYPPPNHERSQQRLLQWGHATPRLQNIPQYSNQLQQLPFDGLILDIEAPQDGRGLSWTIFSDEVDAELLNDMRQQFVDYEWGKLTDNFLRVNIYNPELTWESESWDIAFDNISQITALANNLGFAGIVFDTEQYGAVDIFDYPAQNMKSPKSFDNYRQLAYQRGIDIMQAIQTSYPDITVIYTLGITHRLAWIDSPPLEEHRYGLLVPFIEGMISVVEPNVTLIDGYESSYVYRTETEFATAYKWIRGGVSTKLENPDDYQQHMRAGFGLWIDPYCGDGGLPEAGCGFTPDEFTQALSLALQYSDRYVWLYDEHIDWYNDAGIPQIWWDTLQPFKQ